MSLTLAGVLEHTLTFVAGGLTYRFLSHNSRGHKMMERAKLQWRKAIPWFLAAVVMLAFGFQQVQFQQAGDAADRARDDADHDRYVQAQCLSSWGADVIGALSARVDANDDLKVAQKRRDEALDAIIGVVIASRAAKAPTAQTRKDFDAALTEFAAAKAELVRTQRKTSKTLRANPYPLPPTLTCT